MEIIIPIILVVFGLLAWAQHFHYHYRKKRKIQEKLKADAYEEGFKAGQEKGHKSGGEQDAKDKK